MVLVAKTKYFQQQDHKTIFFFLIIQKSLKYSLHYSKNVTQRPSFFESSVFSYPDIQKGYFLFFYFLSPEFSTTGYLCKVSSLVLHSKLSSSLAKIITISFHFFLHVTCFLTVHSLFVPALFPLDFRLQSFAY